MKRRWPQRSALATLSALGMVACVPGGGRGGQGGATDGNGFAPLPSVGFRSDDRVVIGDFTRVTALAATTDRVYVVYPTAVAVWHPVEQQWSVPTAPREPDILRTLVRAATDPLDHSLWIATTQWWLHYDPDIDVWTRFAAPPPRQLDPGATVDDAMRDLPQLRALAPHIATGPMLRQGHLTAAALDPLHRGWFLGTSTRGLVFFDRMASDATPIPMGLPGELVGAIGLSPDGIWVGTDAGAGDPAGVTWLSADLSRTVRVVESPTSGLPFSATRAVLSTPDALWLGTDRGVVRINGGGSGGNQQLTRFDAGAGLPDQRVLALARYQNDIIAGTARGVAAMSEPADSGFVRRWGTSGEPVYSLLPAGDTLWVGTARGLYAATPTNADLRMPEGFVQLVADHVPILGIGYVRDTLVAMTADRLVWRDPASGGWTEGPLLSTQLGQLTAFVATPHGAWIGGTRGAGLASPTSLARAMLAVPAQLPGEVTSIAIGDRYLWIGTVRGLVRFRLDSP